MEPGYKPGKQEQWQPTVREEILSYMLHIADVVKAGEGRVLKGSAENVGENVTAFHRATALEGRDTYSYLKGVLRKDFQDSEALVQFLKDHLADNTLAQRLVEPMSAWIAVSKKLDQGATVRAEGPSLQNVEEKKKLITEHAQPMASGSSHYEALLRGLDEEIVGLVPAKGGKKPPLYIGTLITQAKIAGEETFRPQRVTGFTSFMTESGQQGLIISLEPDSGSGEILKISPDQIIEAA